MRENRALPEIVDLGNEEIESLLEHINFGHLGLARNDRPYVIPIHFGYRKPNVYFFTTEGMKTDILDENPTVCLQVEDIQDTQHWQSVIITGIATQVTAKREFHKAMKLIKSGNRRLLPAWSIRWLDGWVRSMVEVIYRIDPDSISGRTTVNRSVKFS